MTATSTRATPPMTVTAFTRVPTTSLSTSQTLQSMYMTREGLPDADEEQEDSGGDAAVEERDDGTDGLEDELFRG